MKYKCKPCKYSTYDQSNYNRHMKSKIHEDTKIKISDSSSDTESLNFICECGKKFMHASSLSRHKKKCNNTEQGTTKLSDSKDQEMKQLMNKVNSLIDEVTSLKTQINESKHIIPVTNINKNTYIKISVKNYIKQYWPNAPAIAELENPNEVEDEDSDRSLINALVYNYNNNSLPTYLGNYIAKNYKKEDPSQQSVWTSDVPRLNFLVKELIANGDSEWIDDIKGKKVKNYIVNPFLKFIDDECQEFYNKNQKKLKKFTKKTRNRTIPFGDSEIKESIDTLNIYKAINGIKNSINCGTLANDIIKCIAPELYLDEETRKIKNNNEIEVDEDSENDIAEIE